MVCIQSNLETTIQILSSRSQGIKNTRLAALSLPPKVKHPPLRSAKDVIGSFKAAL
jgi:hypothetical protein